MQLIINAGARSVSIYANTDEGPYYARLYVNCSGPSAGELGSATEVSGRFKSLKRAQTWATKQLQS